MSGPILLPAKPAVKSAKIRMVDYGGALTPSLGGSVQTLMRLGTRHAYEQTYPPIPSEPQGRIWSARLRLAKLYGAIAPFLQDGFRPGVSAGATVARTDGQTGTTLALSGFTPGYPIREGQAFNHIAGGRRYLYFAAAETLVAGDGTVTLPIFPMLRKVVAIGAAFDFDKPMIQGSLSGNELAWDVQTAPWCDFGTIVITEDE